MTNFDNISEQMVIRLYERVNYLRGPEENKLKLNSKDQMQISLAWHNFVGADSSAIGFDAIM